MFGMLRNFTKEDREQYIERIHRLNFNLDKLVNGAPQTAAVAKNESLNEVNFAGYYQQVRNHAINLYDALKERLQISSCHCKVYGPLTYLTFLMVSFANQESLWMRRYLIGQIFS